MQNVPYPQFEYDIKLNTQRENGKKKCPINIGALIARIFKTTMKTVS